jgi:hypothetical protein
MTVAATVGKYAWIVGSRLAFCALLAGLGAAWHASVTAKRTATSEHIAESATAANAEWQTTALELQASLQQCQQQWALQNQSAAAAVAQARQGRAEAQRQADAWAKRWDERTASCDASLSQMEVACAHLSGY